MILPQALYAELERVYEEPSFSWRLPGTRVPVSVTDEEGALLYQYVREYGVQEAFEVATGFGMSSFYIGMALRETGGYLTSIDTYGEEETQEHERIGGAPVRAPRGALFAMRWRRALDLPVSYVVAQSPQDVGNLMWRYGVRPLDFAFIDGYHYGDAPMEDVRAILPFLNHRVLLAFHDGQAEAVQAAIAFAAHEMGGTIERHPTRHKLTFVRRSA